MNREIVERAVHALAALNGTKQHTGRPSVSTVSTHTGQPMPKVGDKFGTAAACGSPHCAGCYDVVDGRKFTHPSAAKSFYAGELGTKEEERGNSMESAKRIIRKTLLDVMQSEEATFDQRIKAARMLTKLLGLAKSTEKQKVQGRTVSKNSLDDLLSKVETE
jgi:hypothetical protein